jgi:transposase
MIVFGADAHKRSHTIVALSATTGELVDEQTVQVGARGFAALLSWARGLGGERVWALEDCRHVSGSFERFLIGRGERVLRVTTKLMAASRRGVRARGKSDSIDAIAVARAALREGLDALPAAQLEGPELDLRLLVDHRERLIRQRVALNNTLQWHLHDLWPELELPGSSLFYGRWAPRVARRLARLSRPCASASPVTSCGASASSRSRSRHWNARPPSSSPRSPRSCSQSRGSDP